ncbi:Acetamidase [Vanrija pseudolonga]|uniref:amidase n=1 Tax=Vanrija pseudolonga TaxID=143232 RepID=A0AAF0Y9G5_9TREE|nr:Acetamidase [Vanrija pseudolonga]
MTSTTAAATTWQARAETKQAAREALLPADTILPPGLVTDQTTDVTAIPRTSGLLSAHELEITESETPAILAKLASGEWTSEAVTRAFCRRASIAHQLTNCLTEIFFDKGIARAKALDEEFKRTGKARGPLHGLPVSLKEQIGVAGVERSFGFVGFIGRVAEVDSALVEILLAQGAIPYCATNIAQGLFFGEAVNNVFGETVNPYNRKLTPGGSSGGEGALLALRGSPLGVGSDIGGSVRIPAGHCGLYSLRPSYQRIPYEGTCNSQEGQDSIRSVLGPMSTSLGAVKTLFKSVLDAQPWRLDPQVLRQGWREEGYALADHGHDQGLVFGMMWDDGSVRPAPPYARAMTEVKAALEAAGHKVVDFVPYEAAEGTAIMYESFGGDGMRDLFDTLALSGEPRVGPQADQPQGTELTITQWWSLHARKGRWLKGQLDAWNATSKTTGTGRAVDAIICPVAGGPAQVLRTPQYHTYTHWCNVADFPAVAIPVTRVDPALDPKVERSDYHGDMDKHFWEQYDPQVYANSPIGLQVVAQKGEDEAVLAMAEIVDNALKAHRAAHGTTDPS